MGVPRTRIVPAVAVVALAAFAAVSFHQIGYWHDSIRLLGHEAAVLPDHPTPHQYLAAAYLYAEQPDEGDPRARVGHSPRAAVGRAAIQAGRRPG